MKYKYQKTGLAILWNYWRQDFSCKANFTIYNSHTCLFQELNPDLFDPETIQLYDAAISEHLSEVSSKPKQQNNSTVWNTIKDLHMELFYMYHRVCLKLLNVPLGMS